MAERNYTTVQLYRRLLRQVRPFSLNVAGLTILSLLSIPMALLAPVPLKIVVDNVLANESLPAWMVQRLPPGGISPVSLLLAAVLLLVGITLLDQLRDLGNRFLQIRTSEEMVLRFRSQLFSHAQRLSLAYHDSEGTSDTTYRIFYDAPAIQYLATDGIIPLVTSILMFSSMLFVIARLSLPLTLVALSISPILFLLARQYRTRLRRQSRSVKRLESGSLSVVQETLSALRVVKAFGQEKREESRFRHHARDTMRARLQLTFQEGTLDLLLSLTVAIGTGLVLYLGARQVLDGVLTLGELLLVIGYLSQLYGPLKTVSRKVARLQAHLASAERAYTLLDRAPEIVDRPGARTIERAQGAVVFDDVSFAYDAQQPVLRNVSFEIDAGTTVGVSGQTGAGKSTMMGLLARFYDPTTGCIRLDGVDLRDYRVADLRNQFAIVLQHTILFATSIRENIAYARPTASDEAIEAAARSANAHEFIVGLPDGYDTHVGERGMRLSGGEQQRIGLARAFLKDAPLLILDEPTSAVDTQTESGIIQALQRLMAGRTTFIVSHRPTTLKNCDLLLTIDEDGRSSVTQEPRLDIGVVLARLALFEPATGESNGKDDQHG